MSESPSPQRSYARLYIRAKCDLPIQISYQNSGKDTVLPTRCTNLCVGGFFADLSEQMEIGQRVSVDFLLDGSSERLRLEAEVRHVKEKDTGFQFLDQSETSKRALSKFLEKRLTSPS